MTRGSDASSGAGKGRQRNTPRDAGARRGGPGGSGAANTGDGRRGARDATRSGGQTGKPAARSGSGRGGPGGDSREGGSRRDVPPRAGDRARVREPAASSTLAPPERRKGRSGAAAELGGEQVEGRHAVRELLSARHRPVRQVWVAEGHDPAAILDEILALAAQASVPVRTVNGARLRQAAGTDAPQGVLAFAEPLPESDLDDLASARPGGRAPFLLVLDGLTDPHNLGALLRTAQCAGATGAVLPSHRSAHVTATVAKAAAGAIEYLPMAIVPGIPSALARLADAGLWTVGLDADAPNPLWSLSVATEPIAIVVGAEGAGLSRLAKARCQLLVAIPQVGPISSLNVAAAGALACFEVSRARSSVDAGG
jgi:23S rRNA (guanosine2251-2'-O)-methyltransferase